MKKLPSFTPKSLIRILLRKGFVLDRTKGSHHIYIHHSTGQRVVIPMHNKDLPKGTFWSILKQADISKEELEDLF
ncbi:MAG: type II toxin-antitoxin system HicA family toxin [Bacteroidales bacterium]